MTFDVKNLETDGYKLGAPADVSLVKAAIVTDALTEEGVQPFLDMLRRLEKKDNVTIAKAEVARLDPYFRSMSDFYARAIERSVRKTSKKEELQKLTSPGGLSNVFNKMAEYRKNTMLSEVTILPWDIKEGPAKDAFKVRNLDIEYEYANARFSFGVVQVFEDGNRAYPKSSTIVPMMRIDEYRTAQITQESAQLIYSGLQEVMTLANHDMLHHFTLPITNPGVVHVFDEKARGKSMDKWAKKMEGDDEENLYEDWSQAAHEYIILQPQNTVLLEKIQDATTRYFTALKDLQLKNPPEDIPNARRERHKAIDFFGTVMCHALTRILPLNHPVMEQAVSLLEQADPIASDIVLRHKDEGWLYTGKEKDWMWVHEDEALNRATKPIVQSYAEKGAAFLPDPKAETSYKNAKMLQLIKLSSEDVRPHAPLTGTGGFASIRGDIGATTLDMIQAAAKDAEKGLRARNKKSWWGLKPGGKNG